MHVSAALIAYEQATEAVQPGEAAFYDPALGAEARAMRRAATGDLRRDATGAQSAAVAVVIVAAVGEQAPRPLPRPTDTTADRRHGVQ